LGIHQRGKSPDAGNSHSRSARNEFRCADDAFRLTHFADWINVRHEITTARKRTRQFHLEILLRTSYPLMLSGQEARDYCLEMICADFLAGPSLDVSGNGDSLLLLALSRIELLLPNSQRQEFLLRIPQAS
jgi:hypothetical protein